MTDPVRPASPADRAWAELAAQLTPAASLARIDAVTARAVTTITIIGVLLTGLGALSAGQLAHDNPARGLAAAAVITATLAVACALTAQVLTITRRLNPANLTEVQAWYQRQFQTRARATQAATILLILAALLAGGAAATSILTTPAATNTRTPAPGTAAAARPSARSATTASAGEPPDLQQPAQARKPREPVVIPEGAEHQAISCHGTVKFFLQSPCHGAREPGTVM